MFKFAEEELLNELDKLENEVEPIKEELDNIKERLENITNYDDLNKDNSIKGVLTFVALIFGIGFGGLDIISLNAFLSANVLKNGIGLLITLGTISVCFFGIVRYEIKNIISNNIEIKELKQKGVKKDKKDESVLLEKIKELESEKEVYQDRANEINKVLEHINFYNEKVNNLYYQVDSKEEFYAKLENFEKFLQERPDYSKVHYDVFDSTISPIALENENMTLKKVLK